MPRNKTHKKKKKKTVTPWNRISLLSASFQGATLRAHFVIHFNAFNFKGWQDMHAHSLPATKFLRLAKTAYCTQEKQHHQS